uniref:Uncharacterized protein n=1 Tax=Picea sitchensis TaxID=3332 RepID=A9NYH1_PICSI|nr:unknown [Picea sitchensis]
MISRYVLALVEIPSMITRRTLNLIECMGLMLAKVTFFKRFNLWFNLHWMGTMSLFLHMAKQDQGKLTQWKGQVTTEDCTLESLRSCLIYLMLIAYLPLHLHST